MAINTEEALAVVAKYKAGLESQNADNNKVIAAFQVLEDDLNGILDTPAQDLVDKQAELTALEASKDAEIAALQARVTELEPDAA